MSYSEFTSIEKLAPLGIDTIEAVSELIKAEPIPPSDFLKGGAETLRPAGHGY